MTNGVSKPVTTSLCDFQTYWRKKKKHHSLKSLDYLGDGAVFILQTAKYLQPTKG